MSNNQSTPPDQYAALLKGAITAHEYGTYLDSLQTGLSNDKAGTLLVELWGIHDQEEAEETLDTLTSKGSSYYLDNVYQAFLLGDQQTAEDFLAKQYHHDRTGFNKAYSLWENLMETYKELTKLQVFTNAQQIQSIGIVAWDVARIVFISRLCLQMGYITQDKAWEYIAMANDKAKETFRSWKDFSTSYILGKAMYGGDDAHLSNTLKVTQELLNNTNSPWVHTPWE